MHEFQEVEDIQNTGKRGKLNQKTKTKEQREERKSETVVSYTRLFNGFTVSPQSQSAVAFMAGLKAGCTCKNPPPPVGRFCYCVFLDWGCSRELIARDRRRIIIITITSDLTWFFATKTVSPRGGGG